MKALSESYASVFVREMTVKIRIGLRPSEAKPQPVVVSVQLFTDPVSYLKDISETAIINYERIHGTVMEWPGRPHVGLVETYIRELLDLSFSFPAVTAAKVSLSKPEIFKEAQGTGVEVFMTRDEYKNFKPPRRL